MPVFSVSVSQGDCTPNVYWALLTATLRPARHKCVRVEEANVPALTTNFPDSGEPVCTRLNPSESQNLQMTEGLANEAGIRSYRASGKATLTVTQSCFHLLLLEIVRARANHGIPSLEAQAPPLRLDYGRRFGKSVRKKPLALVICFKRQSLVTGLWQSPRSNV